ncbi:MAG: NrfD/PsrC family molybdoenzyme membrane anchor subunit [Syntrophales bacterium]|nr:NrfD/PsrC family molybdoenzyme membrane anchor subunit [Syntrophales bacterium]
MEAAQNFMELSKQVVGFIYPNEIDIQWSILIVVYPYITGLVAGAFILASLVKVFNVKELQPTYRLAMLTALALLIIPFVILSILIKAAAAVEKGGIGRQLKALFARPLK